MALYVAVTEKKNKNKNKKEKNEREKKEEDYKDNLSSFYPGALSIGRQ